ncbi:flippase [Natrononativus amylolyticus]|uniref:flippase n=1 Tax=Natrononativus amylolyticus TaxID=2963434 RepID=UPI0020CEA554|nr:flippase [Natrononativus amylolyticus]
MGVEERIVSGFKAEFAMQVIKILAGGLLIVVLARLLTAEQYGILHLTIYLCSIVVLLSNLGIPRAGARYITEYEEKDPGQIPNILKTALGINAITVGVGLTLLFLFRGQIAVWFGEPALETLLLLGILYVIFENAMELCRRFLQGFKRVEWSASLPGVFTITKFVAAISLVVLGYSVAGALLGYVVGLAVASLVGAVMLYSTAREYTAAPIEPGLRRRLFEYSLPLTVTSSSNILMKRVDIVLLGFFLTPVAVGYYTVSKQLISFASNPSSSLGFSISPHYSSEYSAGDVSRAAELYKGALRSMFVLYVPAVVGLILVAEPTVRYIFGAEYMGAVPIVQVLSIYLLADSITNVTGSGLDYLGKAKFRGVLKGTMAISNATLGILLIPTIGVLGAAIPTVVTYGIYALGNVYMMCRLLSISHAELLRMIAKIVPLSLLMGAAVYSLLPLVTGLVTLFLVVATAVVAYGLLGVYTNVIDMNQLKKLASSG